MDSLKAIIGDLKTVIDMEIQAGRRKQPIDPDVAESFLHPRQGAAAQTAPEAPQAAPLTPATPPPQAAPLASAAITPTQTASAAAAAPAAYASLEEIAAKCASCSACPLCASRTHSVPGEGASATPDIMIVGEAPGQDEDASGHPFVGRSGALVTKMIEAMGYTRQSVFIANVCKCRPPDNRTPKPEEMAACMPYLKGQIQLVRPRVIVAFGAVALRGLMGNSKLEISKVRGIWHDFEGIPVMPTYHPAYLLRNPGAKRVVWNDLLLVLARLGRTPPQRQK